ncbi:hypothetical protein AB0E59_41210 [Lentzea sp. NPDC034063]|uniref:hypothetical protein n=1 Tax=unclassified Lentzea TaxID=2643253 RepID=UPI0034096DB9
MRVTKVLLAVIVTGVTVAGCSTAPADNIAGPSVPNAEAGSSAQAPSKEEENQIRIENLIADCMKAQGFNYVAHPVKPDVVSEQNLSGRDPSQVPFDALKSYREKYGFAIYGRDVFTTDPNVGNKKETPNPNTAIRSALDAAQQKAYDKALKGKYPDGLTMEQAKELRGNPIDADDGGCQQKASIEVYPPKARPEESPDPAKEAAYAQALQNFYTDPKLLEASQAYGACLRQQGFAVESTKPGTIESQVRNIIFKERSAQPRQIDPAVAQQGLRKEITASLTDLDCGKDYLALAKPFMEKLLSSEGGNG